ncbi:MAG: hypothetical protein RSA68_03765 [Hafnia sp.]|uniref:hypothetical protein n=1 Tax=Hafnia sp. TaxID=1873498 RepID=UPI002FCA5F32
MSNTMMLAPQTFDQAMQFANAIAASQFAPTSYRGKPNDVLIAMQMGAELGFQPMQSVQGIAVINGRPSVWGDALRALILSAPDLAEFEESYDEATQTAHCKISRRLQTGGIATFNSSFSVTDAQTAGLWGKNGPWKQYPKRMQQWRALGFCARDSYADRLKGIQLAEEVQDYEPIEKVVHTPSQDQDSAIENKITEEQSNRINEILISVDSTFDDLKKACKSMTGRDIDNQSELTSTEAAKLISSLERKLASKTGGEKDAA